METTRLTLMALIVLVTEIIISRDDGLAAFALHSMDLLEVTHATIISQQVRSPVLMVLGLGLVETMISRLAGHSTTEIAYTTPEIAINSLLFFCNCLPEVLPRFTCSFSLFKRV
jgi:hypothetical protein